MFQDLASYLESSKNGVIYISFGTNVKPSLLPAEKLKIFKKVFSELPYDILWKWDSDKFSDCPKNVKFAKWLPQSDLLSKFLRVDKIVQNYFFLLAICRLSVKNI